MIYGKWLIVAVFSVTLATAAVADGSAELHEKAVLKQMTGALDALVGKKFGREEQRGTLVYSFYLHYHKLMPRYPVVLVRKLRSGRLGRRIRRGEVRPGDVVLVRNPRLEAGYTAGVAVDSSWYCYVEAGSGIVRKERIPENAELYRMMNQSEMGGVILDEPASEGQPSTDASSSGERTAGAGTAEGRAGAGEERLETLFFYAQMLGLFLFFTRIYLFIERYVARTNYRADACLYCPQRKAKTIDLLGEDPPVGVPLCGVCEMKRLAIGLLAPLSIFVVSDGIGGRPIVSNVRWVLIGYLALNVFALFYISTFRNKKVQLEAAAPEAGEGAEGPEKDGERHEERTPEAAGDAHPR